MKRYQIFISSTYSDLRDERSAVVESILKLRHIPVGMELFVAANNEQFNYIKRVINESDYYILIIGNRYGTIADDGISYTEKEFNYAVEKELPILAFINNSPEAIPFGKSEKSSKNKKLLSEFIDKVSTNRLVSLFNWETPVKLANEVLIALINTISDCPRPGWERVSSFGHAELLEQLNNLRVENASLKQQLNEKNNSPVHIRSDNANSNDVTLHLVDYYETGVSLVMYAFFSHAVNSRDASNFKTSEIANEISDRWRDDYVKLGHVFSQYFNTESKEFVLLSKIATLDINYESAFVKGKRLADGIRSKLFSRQLLSFEIGIKLTHILALAQFGDIFNNREDSRNFIEELSDIEKLSSSIPAIYSLISYFTRSDPATLDKNTLLERINTIIRVCEKTQISGA